ncbi:hypothetical protein vBCbaSRXM_86 [Citromicrobium phage vB_CbaS-RXM]|nr:hypothetical protein vBCbaSRXM_86 [Citromicrobium phage vB_CbaS-RXM]
MLLKFAGHYSVKLVAQNPTKMFVFGDNLQRIGTGGQAIIRNCPNALGVATKYAPSMTLSAFFHDRSLSAHIRLVFRDLLAVEEAAKKSDVVVPVTKDGHISLGLGLARLDQTSPTTYKMICAYLDSLAENFGGGWSEWS